MHDNSISNQKVIFYDATCNLCLQAIAFVRRKEKGKHLAFVPLQESEFKNEATSSIIFRENSRIYRRSEALLKIARHLRSPYSWLGGFIIIPGFIRNRLYDCVARNRYRWFGRVGCCQVNS